MSQVIFRREVLINAPLTHVWSLVATEEGLRQWWGNMIHLEAKEGGRCEEWRQDRTKFVHWLGVVTRYDPPHQLTLTLRAQDAPPDTPEMTTITIALESTSNGDGTGEQTHVHVIQRAFGTADAIDIEQPRKGVPLPDQPQDMPLAQLRQPAPGALPMPSTMPTTGNIDPVYHLLTPSQRDALIATWEARLTSLAATVR